MSRAYAAPEAIMLTETLSEEEEETSPTIAKKEDAMPPKHASKRTKTLAGTMSFTASKIARHRAGGGSLPSESMSDEEKEVAQSAIDRIRGLFSKG